MHLFSLFNIGHLILISNSYIINTLTKIHNHHFCPIILESIPKTNVFYFRHWGGPGCGSWAGRCCSSSVSCAERHSCLPFVAWVWPTKQTKTKDHKWLTKRVRGGEKVEEKGRVSVLVVAAYYPQLPPLSWISQHNMTLTMSFVSSSPGGGTFRQKKKKRLKY